MFSQSLLLTASFASLAFGQGYILPTSGTASTTQFNIGEEFGGGTSCGQMAFPGNAGSTGAPGGGPGFLYAAINQLAFGANPSAGAGGPGAACGLCYQLTPAGGKGANQSMTFMIVDECPASPGLQRGASTNCNQCSASDKNSMGQTFHFDIAVDAMNQQQYNTFFNGAWGRHVVPYHRFIIISPTDESHLTLILLDNSNWKAVNFQQVSCTSANPTPPIKPWGCVNGCKNNGAAAVCAGV
ncbi:MAG: hypothetical protein M1835_002105 [Candelina submexicana]|nr:MAG: hypothetical protein M1835_002105 [Candelina submexicana]